MAVKLVFGIGSLGEIERYLPKIYDERIPLLFKRVISDPYEVYYLREPSLSKGALVLHPSRAKDPHKFDHSKVISLPDEEINPLEGDLPKAFLGVYEGDYLKWSEPPRWTKSKPHEVPPRTTSEAPEFWFSSFEELSLVYREVSHVVLAPSPEGPWEIYETFSTALNSTHEGSLYVSVELYFYGNTEERKVGQSSAPRITQGEMEAGTLYVGLRTKEEIPKSLLAHWVQSVTELQPYLERIFKEQIPLIFKNECGESQTVYAFESSVVERADFPSLSLHPDRERGSPLKQIIVRDDQLRPVAASLPKLSLGIDIKQWAYLQEPVQKEPVEEKPSELKEAPPEIFSGTPAFQFASFDDLRSCYRDLSHIVVSSSPEGPWSIYEACSFRVSSLGWDQLCVVVHPYYKGLSGQQETGWGSRALISREKMDTGKQFVGLRTEEEMPQQMRLRSKSNPEQPNPPAASGRKRSVTVHYAEV